MSQFDAWQSKIKENLDQVQDRIVTLVLEKEASQKHLSAIDTELSELFEKVKVIKNVQSAVSTSDKLVKDSLPKPSEEAPQSLDD